MIDKEQNLFIGYLANKLGVFQEQWDQIIKQEEEELQHLREKYHNKQHKIVIGSSTNKLKVSRETSNQKFKIKEEILKQIREDLIEKSNMFSS